MVIDSLDTLAHALHTKRSAYAVLLGSGISRAAGIPTGWDIVTDLTRRLARLKGASAADEADPIAWYRSVSGAEPDYAELLAAVAKTPNERNQLLRSYFEPADDERERGLKVPTPAHKAIATLAKMGKVRVVVTTNFDRLMEQALEVEGVQSVVLGTADA
ncbi:MAG: SIR2 family protein, partial [Ktedonobacterales bacterium]